MNTAHLRTLLAIRRTGSLSAAAREVNLSHSALSVQMKQLEAEIGAPLFHRETRPATLTVLGRDVAEEAARIVEQIDRLGRMKQADIVTGSVSIGFVPTTLQTLLPAALTRLRGTFPDLHVTVRSGLSAHLAREVETGALDFAIVTAPVAAHLRVALYEIGSEELFLVMKPGSGRADMSMTLSRDPYIAFSRETWLGRYIDTTLSERGLHTDPAIELDSIDAVENLVSQGFGVSVVPQRLLAPPLRNTLRCIPFDAPVPMRRLMLAAAPDCRRKSVLKTLADITG